MIVTSQTEILVRCEGKGRSSNFQERALHTYIYLDYSRIEFLSCKKRKSMLHIFWKFFNEWKEQRGLIFYGLGFSSSWIKAIICSYQKKKSDYGVVSQKIGFTLNQPQNSKTSNRYA